MKKPTPAKSPKMASLRLVVQTALDRFRAKRLRPELIVPDRGVPDADSCKALRLAARAQPGFRPGFALANKAIFAFKPQTAAAAFELLAGAHQAPDDADPDALASLIGNNHANPHLSAAESACCAALKRHLPPSAYLQALRRALDSAACYMFNNPESSGRLFDSCQSILREASLAGADSAFYSAGLNDIHRRHRSAKESRPVPAEELDSLRDCLILRCAQAGAGFQVLFDNDYAQFFYPSPASQACARILLERGRLGELASYMRGLDEEVFYEACGNLPFLNADLAENGLITPQAAADNLRFIQSSLSSPKALQAFFEKRDLAVSCPCADKPGPKAICL